MSDTDAARSRRGPVIGITLLFAVLYGYDLFEAIANVIGVVTQLDAVNALAASADVDPIAVPWVVLVLDLALPPAFFVAALLLGRRRSLGLRALILLGGLAVVAAVTLSITALA